MESFKRAAEQAVEHARNWRKKGGGTGGESPTPKPKSGDGTKKKELADA